MRILAVIFITISSLCTETVVDPAGAELRPVMVWSDVDSKITEESFRCIRSPEEWGKLWKAHKVGADADKVYPLCPVVDFEAYMIVALFRGKSIARELAIESVRDEKDALRVRYRPHAVSIFITEKTNPRAFDTQSYAFAVLPKSKKTIIIEEKMPGARPPTADPPVWRERARIEAVK